MSQLIINPHNSKKLSRRLTSALAPNEMMGVAATRGKYLVSTVICSRFFSELLAFSTRLQVRRFSQPHFSRCG